VTAGWFGLLHHPNFRAAVERNAGGVLHEFDRRGAAGRWLTRDRGRGSTLARTLIIFARAGEVSVADVLARTRARRTVSDGRVLRLFAAAAEAGLMGIVPPTGPWRTRRLVFRPAFLELFRRRAAVEIEAAALVAPDVSPALALIASEAMFWRFMSALGRYDGLAPEQRGPPNPGMLLFLEHDHGLMMLYDLMLRQPLGRARLLQAAPFSRATLARRFEVSRAHVTRLFAEAEAKGHISLAEAGRVVFSPAFNEEAERHFAATFHVMRLAALEAMKDIESHAAAHA
jgi:CRP-like cAMP-binding protein